MDGWEQTEVEATLDAYFRLMQAELGGRPMVKVAVYRDLARAWGRSWKAYERKMQNISAVLVLHDHPYLKGLVPLVNIQRSLEPVTLEYLRNHPEALVTLSRYRNKLIVPYTTNLFDGSTVSEPPTTFTKGPKRGGAIISQEEIAEKEANCKEIGLAGEQWVVHFEKARLRAKGRPELAEAVEHVSVTRGDGLGYDILSYDTNERELHIEVKATPFKIGTPFMITRNELQHASEHPDAARLYRVFQLYQKPRLYMLAGSLEDKLQLDAISYRATVLKA
jgi:hypothetical protein